MGDPVLADILYSGKSFRAEPESGRDIGTDITGGKSHRRSHKKRGGKFFSSSPPKGAAEKNITEALNHSIGTIASTDTGSCSLNSNGGSCASPEVKQSIIEFVETISAKVEKGGTSDSNRESNKGESKSELLPVASDPASEAVREAASILGCDSEVCVLNSIKSRAPAPVAKAIERDLETRYKRKGPRNSTALLSNYDIDGTMDRWAAADPTFYHCNFAMMDFDDTGDELAEVNIAELFAGTKSRGKGKGQRFTTFGCVVNTDYSTGPGKHWVAVFVDGRNMANGTITVEYFNSAGHPPPRQMLVWMARTVQALEQYCASAGIQCKVTQESVTSIEHQNSRTECGLYSLYYIRRRLDGVPFGDFKEHWVPDDAMIEFRKHCFV